MLVDVRGVTMPIDLSPEDQQKAEALVASGRFTSVSEALHAGLEAIQEEEEWQDYARDRIAAGLEDLEAGRTMSGDDFLAWLQTQRQKQA
jgi:putative addiction module CopG family antidote